jgi:translocation and assembly module TamA
MGRPIDGPGDRTAVGAAWPAAVLLAAVLTAAGPDRVRAGEVGVASTAAGPPGLPVAEAHPAAAAAAADAAPAGPVRTAASEPSAFRSFLSSLPLVGRFFGDPDDAPSRDGSRVAPHYALEVQAPEPIVRLVREHTLLGRWRQRPDYDPSQLPLFVRRAEEEVRGLLAAEGWFSPELRIESTAAGVRIVVTEGPRTRVAGTSLELSGEVRSEEHAALRERLAKDWRMPDGAAFRSEDWESAKRALLSQLGDAGFLRARIEDSEALVAQDRAIASLRLSVDSGTRLRFGNVDVGGLQRYPASVVEGLVPFTPGEPYDARRLFELQTRLNGAGWFSTVNVRPDTLALDRDAGLQQVPIRVDVVERQSKRWTLGGGYDTDRGFNVLAGWEHRNVAGLGIQTFNGIELDLERQLAFTTWETPQDVHGHRWQFGARGEHRDIRNDLVDAASLFVSNNRRRGDIETAVSLQWQYERQSVVLSPAEELLYANRAMVLGYSWTQRRLDSPLFPTEGYVLSGQLSGASASLGSMRSFVRAYAFGYALVPLVTRTDGAEWGRLAFRGEVGSVFADAAQGIPSANLFRTGGARSVRGYGSQSLGVQVGEATLAGRFLTVLSAEYQYPVTRDIALAAFYDWGDAADRRTELKPVAGYGLGVRWRTPVGPLNFDVAYGEAVREYRLHFSIGVVF